MKSEYKNSDKILTSSRNFDQSILQYGDYRDKIIYFPQWSDGTVNILDSAFLFQKNYRSFQANMILLSCLQVL